MIPMSLDRHLYFYIYVSKSTEKLEVLFWFLATLGLFFGVLRNQVLPGSIYFDLKAPKSIYIACEIHPYPEMEAQTRLACRLN